METSRLFSEGLAGRGNSRAPHALESSQDTASPRGPTRENDLSTLFITSVSEYEHTNGYRAVLSNGDAISVTAYPHDYQGAPKWESAYIPVGVKTSEWDVRTWTESQDRSGGLIVWLHLAALGLS